MDNKLELFNSYQLIDTDSSEFYIRPNITGAFSNQRFENNLVSDLRLASTLTSEWKQDLKAFGTFRLKNTNNISFYPSTSAWQYAFRLQPAWIIPFAQHSFVTSYDFQITNAASPFDGNIDRLSDINQIHAYWHYDATDFIKGNLKNTVGIAYDWRKDSTQNQSLLRSAYWVLDTKQNFNMLEWVLRLELQAAAFFSQVDDPDLRAGILLNNDFYHNDWRYHFKTEYKFVHPDKENDIDIFEFGLGPVIEFESQRFRPYLAFDFADSLFNAGGLESIKLSGFGFEVLQ